MDNATIALLLTVFVHALGVVALIWALLDAEEGRPDWRGWWRGDDEPAPQDPPPRRPRGDLPLPHAEPSRVRLREPVRLADGYERPERRPPHAPAPRRTPDRV